MLRPQDDLIHQAGAEPWWREAWYWGFYDRRHDLQFVCYLGVFPNQERADVIAAVFQGNRVLHHHMKMDYHIPADIQEDRLSFGPVLMKNVEPMKRWQVYYVSLEIQLDLQFDAVHAPYSWAESKLWMESEKAGASSNHFDQVGRFTGEVRLPNATTAIDSLGYRDRMWGWGGRSKWKQYIMLWPLFDEAFTVNVYPQGFTDGREQLCGYILRKGNRDLLQSADFTVQWPESGRLPTGVQVEVVSKASERLALGVQPLNIVDTSGYWPHRIGHLLFGTAKYTCGGLTGFGDFAYYYRTEAEKPHRWLCTATP